MYCACHFCARRDHRDRVLCYLSIPTVTDHRRIRDPTEARFLKGSVTAKTVDIVDKANLLDTMLYQESLYAFERQIRALSNWTDMRNSIKCVQEMSACLEKISCVAASSRAKPAAKAQNFCSFFAATDAARLELLSAEGTWIGEGERTLIEHS